MVRDVPNELALRPTEGMARWLGPFQPWAMRALSMVEVPQALRSEPTTPAAGYFRRDRHRHPMISAQTYRLKVTGLARDATFDLNALRHFPQVERTLVMECAGNGNHWQGSAGLVAQARWSGPTLASVLEACGGLGTATHFAFRGSDPIPLIRRAYHYGLSASEAMQAGAILALHMNGEDLPRARGFPVRLVVPGIYSMSHVKWLTHIEGKSSAHRGIHNRFVFTNFRRHGTKWVREEVRHIGLKSLIVRCVRIERGWRLLGFAWGGGCPIEGVHVSLDGGSTWNLARLGPEVADATSTHAWTPFHVDLITPMAGPYLVGSRATNREGTQPLHPPDDVRGHFDQTHVKWRRLHVP